MSSLSEARKVVEAIRADRLFLVEAFRRNNCEKEFKEFITKLYPDEAHFVFELLQNAEDAEATCIRFLLRADGLTVVHDGRKRFEKANVNSITNFAKSTKRDEVNSIGKFGVGFKAVFAYTKEPQVFSGDFAFSIQDLFVPAWIGDARWEPAQTRFEFPFNGEKSKTECFKEIAEGLRNLQDSALLFLRNISRIEWDIVGGGKGSIDRREFAHGVVEIQQRRTAPARNDFTYWLRFTEQVSQESNFFVAVAFKLGFLDKDECIYDEQQPLAEQMKIVEAKGQLSIFFPAEKEDTRLRLHLHGPYAATVARDSVPTKNPENRDLLAKTATLLAASLAKVKELGLLTRDFLEVLPNSGDGLSEFYAPLLRGIIDAMNTQPLVPVTGVGHASARELFDGPAAIRSVIQNPELPFFTGKPTGQWVVSAMQGQRADRFLKELAITRWEWNALLVAMNPRFGTGFTPESTDWLKTRNSQWLQAFYAMLLRLLREKSPSYRYSDTVSDEMRDQAAGWRIVRVTTGEHLQGVSVFFPNDDGNAVSPEFPTVDSAVLAGEEKSAAREASEFLGIVGVRKVGEWERLEKLLAQQYHTNSVTAAWADHVEHLQRFVSWAREKKPDGTISFTRAAKFSAWPIFKAAEATGWLKPTQAFLDTPFDETGFNDLYALGLPEYTGRHALSPDYATCGIEGFADFAEACGVSRRLEVKQVNACNNPHRSELGVQWNNPSQYELNEDFTIERLETILATKNSRLSLLVWKTVCLCPPQQIQARYRRNTQWAVKCAPSQLICSLARTAWVPHESGGFHRPRDTRQEYLLPGFLFDNRNGWLGAVEFGAAFAQPGVQAPVVEQATDTLGQAAQAAGVPREILEHFANNAEAQLEFREWQEEKKKPKRPESEPVNLTRRKQKVAEEVKRAATKTYEERNRSVRTSAWNLRADMKENLRQQNTNEDEEMICQICGDVMPFKVNGKYYFLAVQCILSLTKEVPQNHLGLCPNCAAKYQYARNDSDEQVKAAILATTGAEVAVRLADAPHTILFTRTHLTDLQTALTNL